VVRFLVLYPQPTDVEAFDRHYFEVHAPLTKRLPGLRRYSVGRDVAPIRDEEPYYMVAELEWDDMESLQRDFSSELGQEAARDIDYLTGVCPGIRSMVFELSQP
jgi:uncharacterized protein (TIGR02118 family)